MYPTLAGRRLRAISLSFPRSSTSIGPVTRRFSALCKALQNRGAHARGTGGEDLRSRQPSTRDTSSPSCWPPRNLTCSGTRSGTIRSSRTPTSLSGGAEHEVAGARHGSPTLPLQLLHAHLGQRISGWLLRLSLVRNARRRRLPVVRRSWRTDAGQWRPLPPDDSFARQHGRSGPALQRVARRRARDRSHAQGARTGAASWSTSRWPWSPLCAAFWRYGRDSASRAGAGLERRGALV